MPAASLLYRSALLRSREQAIDRIGIVHAQPDAGLSLLASEAELQLWQHQREQAVALQAMGMRVAPSLSGRFDLILILPSKNRQQTLGWVADALPLLNEGGEIMLCAENRHGARGLESQLRQISDRLSGFSKTKCRCMRLPADAIDNPDMLRQWRHRARMRRVPETGLFSMPGLFSWESLDAGSALLLEHLPENPTGTGMDLCCGNGLLARAVAQRNDNIAHLHLVDHDRLALDCAVKNLAGCTVATTCHWLDAASEQLPERLDWIVCNPPFHRQQHRDIELGRRILEQACRSLRSGGRIRIVANRKLPYEALLQEHLQSLNIVTQRQGYKIIHGVR